MISEEAIDEFCNANEPYTIDYTAEADTAFERGVDISEALLERVETDEKCRYTGYEDLGGIMVFFKDEKVVGFYDYEQYVGRFV